PDRERPEREGGRAFPLPLPERDQGQAAEQAAEDQQQRVGRGRRARRRPGQDHESERVEEAGQAGRDRRQSALALERPQKRASWSARQMRSGAAGMSTCLTPNGARASQTALMIAALEPMVPASPTPLTPSSLSGVGVTVRSSS